tara:strand:+ start:1685 stop:3196 length:1512 start_codon:yes stop_codon:yes gene_type:complete
MEHTLDNNLNKKILFWIDVDSLFLLIAHIFNSKTNSELYSIYDVPDKTKNFFENQSLVNFKKQWFFHDHIKKNDDYDIEYLSNIEKKYGIDLWKLSINERFFYRFNRFYKFSRNEILSILEQECKFFEKILDEINPDCLIMLDPPVHHSKLLHDMAHHRGVKTLSMYTSRIGPTSIVHTDHMLDFEKLYPNAKGSITNFETLRQKWNTTNYTDTIKRIIATKDDDSITEQIDVLKNYLFDSSNNKKTHYTYYGRSKPRVLNDAIKFTTGKKSRKRFIDKNLTKEPDLNSKFVYFPLSDEEESQILHYSSFHTNQIESVRHIAKSIPIDYQLFVKEHPARGIRGWRTIEEYNELLDIPNVVLLHPTVNQQTLFENCSLVVTLRGTAGLEAAFYGKPTLIFGDIFYSVMPSVYQVKHLSNLPELIHSALNTRVNPIDVDRFFDLVINNSVRFNELDYYSLLYAEFFHGGKLVDVEISEKKMKIFFEKNSEYLAIIADEFIKKTIL